MSEQNFPEDFAFQATFEELRILRSQFATTNQITHWNHMRANA